MKTLLLGLGAVAALAGPALAAEPASRSKTRAAMVQKLADCRVIADNVQRLACYDGAAAAFDQAEAKGDIVVVDKEQAKEVRQQAFGFNLPSLNLFDRPDKAGKTESLERITETLANAYRKSDGKWVLELKSGAVWNQTDTELLPRGARAGSTVEIRQAAMGSYFVNVDKQRAIRATRSR